MTSDKEYLENKGYQVKEKIFIQKDKKITQLVAVKTEDIIVIDDLNGG